MNRLVSTAALACAGLLVLRAPSASAHAVAGARVFPVTLTIDDPGVADEASLPTFSFQRPARMIRTPGTATSTTLPRSSISASPSTSASASTAATRSEHRQHGKTQTGFQNINVTVKYQTWVNAPHEAIVSLGVIREFGRTGTAHIGADQYGSTTPTVYFGKGFGDLPVPALRPFAITGTLGYTVADKKLKAIGDGTMTWGQTELRGLTGLAGQQFNNGYANRWVGGLSLQYSLPYLQSQVRDYGLPELLQSPRRRWSRWPTRPPHRSRATWAPSSSSPPA